MPHSLTFAGLEQSKTFQQRREGFQPVPPFNDRSSSKFDEVLLSVS